MKGIRNAFHVSHLRKFLINEMNVVTLDDIEIDPELTSREEPKAILGRKTRQLRNKEIPFVKVQWRHCKGSSIIWDLEEMVTGKHPHLFQENQLVERVVLQVGINLEKLRNDHHCGSDCLPRFSLQDLNLKLNNDVHNLWIESRDELLNIVRSLCEMKFQREEHAAQISTPSLKCPIFYDNDDDEYSIQYTEYLKNSSIVITTSPPVLPIEDPENGPTPHPQTTDLTPEGGAVPPPRNKRDEEFTEEDNRNELADIQAINILSQGLPRRIFNILNQNETGREIWLNTKFANNLPLYWGKYVTHAKNNMNMSTVTYVELFTHLKTYEEHALKSLKKKEQSSAVVDPLAYLAKKTPTHSTTSPVTVPTPQSSGDSHNDAMLATMNQIANLLSGLQKQRAPCNKGTRGIQTTGLGVNNSGKKVICYNCRGEGHVARKCKEPKPPYDQPLALTTTNLFEANHEDAYDSDVDEGPYASATFMANLSSTGGTNGSSSSHINEVQISDDSFFSDVSYLLAQEMQQEEHLNPEVDSVLDDNMITYDEYQNDSGVKAVP
nr:hypothetical protein [Tanacetum cinerariifolium]